VPAEEVLIVAGFQVPVIAGVLVELFGSEGGVEFRQSGPICANVGTIAVVTTIFIVTVVAH
jgi:hypothetical protein